MVHFGIICPSATGHFNPMCALGRELQRRGHRITIFGIPDGWPKVMGSGIDFRAIGENEFQSGTMEQLHRKLGKMNGLAGVKFTMHLLQKEASMFFREAPEALKASGVEALLVDQLSPAGGTIADFLNLPFITVCNLLVHQEAGIPPLSTLWSYHNTWWARLRNRMGNLLSYWVARPIYKDIIRQRRQWKLPPYTSLAEVYGSQLAQICQLPKEFDFPRFNLPACFHYTGPLQDPSGLEVVSFPSLSFPFEKLTGQPLIYASLGACRRGQLSARAIYDKICIVERS